MPDIGWTEMLVIMAIAVIVIGPRDLPKMLRTIGQWVGKARRAVRDLQAGIEDMAREAELDEVKEAVAEATDLDDWWRSQPVGKPPGEAGAGTAGAKAGKPARLW